MNWNRFIVIDLNYNGKIDVGSSVMDWIKTRRDKIMHYEKTFSDNLSECLHFCVQMTL